MAFEVPEENRAKCPVCGLDVPESRLQKCANCGAESCEYCAKHEFGRAFCGKGCRDFFFWGDDDHDETES
jgi:hypothetical protein